MTLHIKTFIYDHAESMVWYWRNQYVPILEEKAVTIAKENLESNANESIAGAIEFYKDDEIELTVIEGDTESLEVTWTCLLNLIVDEKNILDYSSFTREGNYKLSFKKEDESHFIIVVQSESLHLEVGTFDRSDLFEAIYKGAKDYVRFLEKNGLDQLFTMEEDENEGSALNRLKAALKLVESIKKSNF